MGISAILNLFGVKMSLWLKDRRGRTFSDEDILHYPYDGSNLSRNHEVNEVNRYCYTQFPNWVMSNWRFNTLEELEFKVDKLFKK